MCEAAAQFIYFLREQEGGLASLSAEALPQFLSERRKYPTTNPAPAEISHQLLAEVIGKSKALCEGSKAANPCLQPSQGHICPRAPLKLQPLTSCWRSPASPRVGRTCFWMQRHRMSA